MDILKSSQLVVFSHSTIFYNIFLQKSCRFSLQTLTKFEAAKTGSGVGFLRLTAVWVLLYLPTQIRVLIGGERVTCHWSKLNDALGRTKLNDALGPGKQQLELWTRT